MYENLPYESVYFKEPHNEQECYRPTIYRAGEAVVLTITSFTLITIRWLLDYLSRWTIIADMVVFIWLNAVFELWHPEIIA